MLRTNDFHVKAASANVSMTGQVDLVKETQDLHAIVEPSVTDSVAVLVAVVNPLWGLGTYILQKLLKNPIGQALTFQYHITGSWAKPEVARIKAEVRNAPAPPRTEPALP